VWVAERLAAKGIKGIKGINGSRSVKVEFSLKQLSATSGGVSVFVSIRSGGMGRALGVQGTAIERRDRDRDER